MMMRSSNWRSRNNAGNLGGACADRVDGTAAGICVVGGGASVTFCLMFMRAVVPVACDRLRFGGMASGAMKCVWIVDVKFEVNVTLLLHRSKPPRAASLVLGSMQAEGRHGASGVNGGAIRSVTFRYLLSHVRVDRAPRPGCPSFQSPSMRYRSTLAMLVEAGSQLGQHQHAEPPHLLLESLLNSLVPLCAG